MFAKAVDLAHYLVAHRVKPGDIVADATAGNGHDTLALARQVGPRGRVYAFDIQPEAIKRTRELISRENVAARVTLIVDGHERMSNYIAEKLAAVMFNLGYLPGGDRGIITTADTTLPGIRESLRLLKPGGLVTVVIYTGHPGAVAEKEAVLEFGRRLDQRQYTVTHISFINQAHHPPELLTIQYRTRPSL